ncbi:MAG: hypothetical protein WA395_05215 [Nitrososphaeraceae archaeon]
MELADTFLVKGKPNYMGDIVIMVDNLLYKNWHKPVISLGANKPIAEKEGGDAEDIFNQNTPNQGRDQLNKLRACPTGTTIY